MSFLGLPNQREREYATPERLADVMALIQVLSLHKWSVRTEEGSRHTLQGPPRSGVNTWYELAEAHPEFFRVDRQRDRVSLVSRYVMPKEEEGGKLLSPEFVGSLLQAAIDIHDRQVRRCERWTYLIPIWVALIIGLLALAGQLAKCW